MGVNHFWPCSSLILLGKKMSYCKEKKIRVAFSGCQKRIVGEGLNLPATNFTKLRVCACVSVNLKKEKKKKTKNMTARGRCRDNYSYLCHFSIRLDIFIFLFFCTWKKKEKRKKKKGWHVPLVVSAILLTLWAERGVAIVWPRPVPNHIHPVQYPHSTAESEKPRHETRPIVFLNVFLQCGCVTVCACACVCLWWKNALIRSDTKYDILCHFFFLYVGKKSLYIHWHWYSSSLSVSPMFMYYLCA